MSVWDWDDDEVDPEYVRQQRERRDRRAVEPPPPARVQAAVQFPVQKLPTTPGTHDIAPAAKRLCKAKATVRYPKGHELQGQPILNADGARKYKPCGRPPMRGQEVCQKHGGMAPQAQQAAKLRLLQATEPLIAALVRIGLNERLSPADRVRAINSALDRAGMRGGLELDVSVPGWQKMLEGMFGETIDGELADKEPANAASSTQDGTLTKEDIMAINAAMAKQPDKYEPDPNLGFSNQAGPAVDVGAADPPLPTKYKGKGKRARR